MIKRIKLRDIINLQNGYAFKSKEYFPNGYFVMRITNVQKGYISNHNPKYIKIKDIKKFEKFILKDKDILISLTGDVGRVGIIENKHLPCVLNQRVGKVEIIKQSILNKDYLFYFLNSDVFIKKVEKISHGTAQKNVSTKDILDIDFDLPSLEEQKSIVAKLNTVFTDIESVINQTKKMIENTIQIFEEKIKQYFIININNSPIVKLADISNYFNGLTYSPKDISEKGIIVLRSGNIQNGKMEYKDIKRVNKKIKDKLYVKSTDILICSRNGSQKLIGKSSLIGTIKEPMTFGTFMMIIRSEHNKYLQWFVKSQLFKKQILKGENTMINQITRYMLDEITLPFPDKKTCEKIAQNLYELDKNIRILNKILNKKIDNLNSLKSSILQQELLGKFV